MSDNTPIKIRPAYLGHFGFKIIQLQETAEALEAAITGQLEDIQSRMSEVDMGLLDQDFEDGAAPEEWFTCLDLTEEKYFTENELLNYFAIRCLLLHTRCLRSTSTACVMG